MFTALIVEDEALIRKGLLHTVDWAGMDCVVVGDASNGKDGLAQILERRPDIVLTDIRMPQMDGLRMLEEALKVYSFSGIIISGYSEFEYARDALRLEAIDYLLKPIDEGKLRAAVEKAKKHTLYLREAQRAGLREKQKELTPPLSENVENYYVRHALMMIHQQYAERLSLRGAAEALGVSESFLARKFRETTNSTFLDYLNRYRLSKAIRLMQGGGYRIGEVSDLVGFTQYKQFSVVFRRYMGMSPTEYLRQAHNRVTRCDENGPV